MLRRIAASAYSVAALAGLAWGYIRASEDPASYMFAAVCGMPWTFVGSGFAGDFSLIGPAMTVQGILINAGLLWWWALRKSGRAEKKQGAGDGCG